MRVWARERYRKCSVSDHTHACRYSNRLFSFEWPAPLANPRKGMMATVRCRRGSGWCSEARDVASATSALPGVGLGLEVVAVPVYARALRVRLGTATASWPRPCSTGASVVVTSGTGRVTSTGAAAACGPVPVGRGSLTRLNPPSPNSLPLVSSTELVGVVAG